MYALTHGATAVSSVDSSAYAIEGLEKNLEVNKLQDKNHTSIQQDALEYLTKTEDVFDLIILDPPAFAKSISSRHNAIMAYKRINALALKKIETNGILFTYSCSQVVDKFSFTSAVLAAAIETGREVSILHQMSQPADHPINIFHPETEYLKGLVLFVK
jgi:23S rRNA (cytosine1962-C5)-methyltransferase